MKVDLANSGDLPIKIKESKSLLKNLFDNDKDLCKK